MRCPFCHRDDDRVLDTRAAKEGYVVRRKRVCTSCNRRFTTQEQIEQVSVRVVKRDQTREPFDREKIRRGIERACSKRPINSAKIEEVVQSIEADIYSKYEDEVSTDQLGETVIRYLAELDDVAYIRFASVYREFHDVEDFIRAISAIDRHKDDPEPSVGADSHAEDRDHVTPVFNGSPRPAAGKGAFGSEKSEG